MCQVSEKLKLCTCGDKNPKELDNYWELHLYNNGQDRHILGSPLFPLNFAVCKEHEEANEALILRLLNEGDCFDFPYSPTENDVLVFYLTPVLPPGTTIPDGSFGKLVYEYEYLDGKWRIDKWFPFKLMNLYIQRSAGKVLNAFES